MTTVAAHQSLAEGFRAGGRPAAAEGWTDALRREAFERFEALGFPGGREESWRHTNLAPIRDLPFLPGAGTTAEVPAEVVSAVGDAHRILLSPWGVRPEEGTDGLPEGLRIHRFAQVPLHLRERLSTLARSDRDAFVALNTALFDRGAVVELAKGAVLDRPVHLVHVVEGSASPRAAFPRVLVMAGAESEGVIVEHYGSRGEGPTLTAPVTEIFVESGARIDHVRLQEESTGAFHVGRVASCQEAGSRFRSWSLAFGARLCRVEIGARLAGEGAECTLAGLFVGRGAQHLDHYTRIDHASPRTSSRECYKGIVDGRARGVFLGHVLVRPDAQQIDAGQTSRAIVLSDNARVNMKPWLEIYADDVRCTHGTTVGQLDEDALFYLRARGIALEDARALLVRAFAAEVLAELPIPTLRDRLQETMSHWLRQRNGRRSR